MLGIIIALGIIAIGIILNIKERISFSDAAGVVIIGCIALVCTILAPIGGYDGEKLISEIPLTPLYEQGGSNIYVIDLDGSDVVISYTTEEEIFDTTKQVEHMISKKAIVIEDKNCDKPVLREYEKKGKESIWGLAVLARNREYIVYVPEGSVKR